MYVLVVKDEKELIKIANEKGLKTIRVDCADEFDDMINMNKAISIYEILTTLGLKSHLSGFKYLKYILESNIDCYKPVTKFIYPLVAKEFNTTSSRVERAIRHVIETAWYEDDTYELYLKIFGHFDETPTNQQFIRGLDLYLKEHNPLS